VARLSGTQARLSGPEPKPHPPGDYPVVVVGSGPGGIQTSYWLTRLGIRHALLSQDDEPAGMFRRFPLFDRLITWTKPYAPAEHRTRRYEWFDWNSLLADEPELRSTVPDLMDGSSYFPSRMEMERAIGLFAERAGVRIRHGCRWESTRRTEDGFVLTTSDGEYACRVAIFAIGMTQPWKPPVPGLEDVPHYVETRVAKEYADRRVFVVGKRNSGFEIADGLLPWARQIVLASPRPPRISVLAKSTAAARARYLQPYEDHVLGGGTFVLDAAIERVERTADAYVVHAKGTTRPGDLVIEADEVIAATGFATPLQDLPGLGLATFFQGGRLPAQTPHWESPTMPGVFFAGNVTQGSVGLKKFGIPSNSAAVHGFRYNARVLAEHVAETRFGWTRPRPKVRADDVVGFLLDEVTEAPELWNQQSYLARVVTFDPQEGIVDDGLRPLAHFVDAAGPDAVAVTVETDDTGDIHPAVYVRRDGRVDDHVLPSDPLHELRTPTHREQLAGLLGNLGNPGDMGDMGTTGRHRRPDDPRGDQPA
jgi:thioredoxin reductase